MDDRPFDNPQPVDDTLLERIESGQEELTDQLFFKLIKETSLYLGHRLFQKRIAQWQYYLNNHLYSDVEQRDAKKKLLQIGRTLAHEDKGRPEKIPDIAIYGEYKRALEIIDRFLQEHKDDRIEQRSKAFKAAFPLQSKFVEIKKHRSASQIAIHILIKKYAISERSLWTIIKNVSGIVQCTNNKISRAKEIEKAVNTRTMNKLKQNNINISDTEPERFISTHPHT